MANVVTEHVLLLVPMMIVIMIFPIATTYIMNNYNAQQRQLVLEGAGSNIGSTIQQIYLLMSMPDIMPCNITVLNPLLPDIEGQQYLITASQLNNRLTIHFSLPGIPLYYDYIITIGANAVWEPSELNSLVPNMSVQASKAVDGTIYLRFR